MVLHSFVAGTDPGSARHLAVVTAETPRVGGQRAEYRPSVSALKRIASSLWIRALISAGLLVVVATQVDFRAAARLLADGEWGLFVLATGILFAAFIVASVRWQLYLLAAGLPVALRLTVRAFLIGAFMTNFLPSQVGGDVARVWIVSEAGTRTRAAATVVVDRVNGILCLLIVAWVELAVDSDPVPRSLILALTAASGAAIVAGAIGYAVVRGSRRVVRVLPGRFHGLAREAKDATSACLASRVLWPTIAYGLAFQAMVCVSTWLIALSISLDVPFATLIVVLPITVLVGILPVSIGGLGLREASFVVLLGQAGVSATDAAVFSLLCGVAFALASSPAVFLIFWRGNRPGAPTPSS
jgi:uncharacterized membrane protein YbhN (UPF0104 family)